MKLSVVIICWNDLKVIQDCLRSVYAETSAFDFEVIVSDNGSTDGSREFIRAAYPRVRIVENGANLGFARGNNTGIRAARGQYVLILNPDTVIHDRALEKLVAFADRRPQAGAFGCRVLNPDGSFQNPARPLPTVGGFLIAALYLRWLGRLSESLLADRYVGWDGRTERPIGYQSGCCIMLRRDLLARLNGFDDRFFYHFEETDLCARAWKAGSMILFCPDAEITHLGGQSVARSPIRFQLETFRNRYRFFYKHYGTRGLVRIRTVSLAGLRLRRFGYGLLSFVRPSEALAERLRSFEVLIAWNKRLDPVRFIETGAEPDLGYAPLAPAPNMLGEPTPS
jgi:N-acetylglucosaminyl-diphospho-decaprenol L-rhamnosyltransferase